MKKERIEELKVNCEKLKSEFIKESSNLVLRLKQSNNFMIDFIDLSPACELARDRFNEAQSELINELLAFYNKHKNKR